MSDRGRLAKLHPADLDDAQRAVYDAIVGGPRAAGKQHFRLTDDQGRLEGPFNAFLVQPRLGQQLQALGSEIRYGTAMSARAREIAILIVATEWQSAFEWYAHEAVGRGIGLTDDELDAIAGGNDEVWVAPEDALVARVVRSLVEAGDLDDPTYSAAVSAFGEPGLLELLTLVGHYASLALQLRVFRVPLPDTDEPTPA